jgi:phosphoenolpyruvate---glycerone phosphotransferase subunit DhaL
VLIKADHIIKWMELANVQIDKQKEYLTQLDQAIGDGDHGINMSKGFKEVIDKIHQTAYNDIGKLLQDIGMVLVSKVGGASGPLFGTAFIKAGQVLKGKQEIAISELGQAFQESVNGIKLRGKSQIGDKTMLDVWEPVTQYIQQKGSKLNIGELVSFAREQMENTKKLEAKKGRASFLGKRSIGHLDPGAVSSFLLFETLCSILLEENQASDQKKGDIMMEYVGVVLVSHSHELVKGLKQLLSQLSSHVPIALAGGTDEEEIGTSVDKIQNAIKSVYSDKGVVVLFDLGSALINTELAIERLAEENITKVHIADAPLVEGAYAAVVESGCGSSLDKVVKVTLKAKSLVKI